MLLYSDIGVPRRYYIGQAGYGRDLDKGRLHLPGDDNFCMGGPGVIMSRASMKGICPYIESCMQDNVTRSTGEEDVEIGRCFTKHLSVLCTSAYEVSWFRTITDIRDCYCI